LNIGSEGTIFPHSKEIKIFEIYLQCLQVVTIVNKWYDLANMWLKGKKLYIHSPIKHKNF